MAGCPMCGTLDGEPELCERCEKACCDTCREEVDGVALCPECQDKPAEEEEEKEPASREPLELLTDHDRYLLERFRDNEYDRTDTHEAFLLLEKCVRRLDAVEQCRQKMVRYADNVLYAPPAEYVVEEIAQEVEEALKLP